MSEMLEYRFAHHVASSSFITSFVFAPALVESKSRESSYLEFVLLQVILLKWFLCVLFINMACWSLISQKKSLPGLR